MLTKDHFKCSGMFLFRWRGYLPLIFLAAVFATQYFDRAPREQSDTAWALVCLAIGIVGIVIRVFTVAFVPYMTSGRGTDAPYAESLNTTGMYSITRNPIYLGNFFTFLSPVLFTRNLWLLAMYVAVFALYHERIISAEECFLQRKFGQAYQSWSKKTPAFFPNPALWRKSARSFSWKMALRRECISLFTLIATIWGILLFELYLDHRNIVFDQLWVAMFALSGAIYLLVALAVQFTKFFDR